MSAARKQSLAVLLLAVVGGGWGCSLGQSQPLVQHTPVSGAGPSKKYELRLVNSRGEELEYYVREPREVKRALPVVFVLAGLETGRESLDLIDERDDLILLSMNYPRRETLALSGPGLALAPYALRRIATETVEGGILAIDYLSGRHDVDQERIILLGVSFGSVIVTSLGARDPRADVVVLIYGGGDLGHLASLNMRDKPWWLPGWIIAPTIRLFLGDFEPLALVDKIAPRYLLMVNSRQDDMFPVSSAVELFERAGEPKKLIWYETGHLDLFNRELVRRLTRDVVSDLQSSGYLR